MEHPLAKTPRVSSPASNSGHSPASSCDDFMSRSAASFVFVEESVLSRHATVIHEDVLPIDLIPGESKQALLLNVFDKNASQENCGLLLVTNYRMVKISTDNSMIEIPLASILDLKSSFSGKNLALDIKTKDCRFFQFQCRQIISPQTVIKLLSELIYRNLFGLDRNKIVFQTDCFWSLQAEFDRMVNFEKQLQLSLLNSDYQLCSTYPKELIFPSNVSDTTLMGAAKFRDKGRLPVFSWTKNGFGTIFRSAQPKSSLLNRSLADEDLMKAMEVECIIDCRPMLNAYANIANGAGVESLGNYHSGIELWFGAIPNIHHVRDSWEKMFLLSQQLPTSNWFTAMDQTGWYDHISLVLRSSAMLVTRIFFDKKNVLCRCSHGLDRTPQVVSLGMLALDSHYRTIKGLAILIEKEWVRMGHRFVSRFALGTSPTDEMSPIFFQFLEALYQVMLQYPETFEFTSEYLVLILQAVVSGRFETFMFDCEAEKKTAESPWPIIWKHDGILNKSYRENHDCLIINPHVSQMKVFSNIWLSTHRKML